MSRFEDFDHPPLVLCGTKCDLKEREGRVKRNSQFFFKTIVSEIVGRETAKEFEIPYFETSALSRVNIEESVYELVRIIRKNGSNSWEKKDKTSAPRLKNLPASEEMPKVFIFLIVCYICANILFMK